MSAAIPAEKAKEFMEEIDLTMKNPFALEVLTRWTEELAGDLGRGFLSSKDPSGNSWAPLKHPRPAGRNQGHRPLIDTSTLMRSVISKNLGNIEEITDNSVTYGTDIEYAAFHQFGSGNVPARPFVGVSDAMIERAEEMIADHMIRQLDEIEF